MKRTIPVLLIVLFAGKLFCQVSFSDFAAAGIPDSLKKNAAVVYRLNEEILDVTSASKYTLTVHNVITLLNKDGGDYLRQVLYYDKFTKIDNITIKVFNAEGMLAKAYQKKDFSTKDYIDGFSLYTDEKLLSLQAAGAGYPCTVELSYQEKTAGYLTLPTWRITNPYASVQRSYFTVNVAEPLNIRYKALNIAAKPDVTNSAGSKQYKWTVLNLPAIKPEAHTYRSYNLPAIVIVGDAFEYDGYKGEFTSWKSYGAWNYQLYEEAQPFSKDDESRIRGMVADCKNDLEKIKVLYTYLEKNTRYVSVQLGIGGFKPFAVKYVNDKKYGDCKALTNYMRYLLKVVGINAWPALVNAEYNNGPFDANFPCDPFNHVILCVPLKKDSVWLECTSSNNEYGFLGNFTENKNALLLTDKGGVLVATPKSNFSSNLLTTKSVVSLDEDGGSAITSDIFCTGDFWTKFYYIMQEEDDQKKNFFINNLHYRNPDHFELAAGRDTADGKQFHLTLAYDQVYDFKTGDELFMRPRLNSVCSEDIYRLEEKRKFDYLFEFPYSKTDTTIYLLPAGITVDKLPAKKDLDNEYASYHNSYYKNEAGNMVTVVANLILKKSIIPPADYDAVATFFQDAKRSENEKFILKQN